MKQIFGSKVGAFAALMFAVVAGACSDSGSTGITGNVIGTQPAVVAVLEGNAQSAAVGSTVTVAPAVVVKDSRGAPVAGASVSFTVTGGGGSVANATAQTDIQGYASAGAWTLGATAGTNTLEARVGTLAPVQFTATGSGTMIPAAGNYHITVRYLAPPTARQQQAVNNAVARWQSIITRDLINIPLNAQAKACFDTQPAINETIDDLLMFVEFVNIDGAYNVLGQAGPCYVRSDNGLPVVGHLKLDVADLELMESRGTLDDVVMHEIGHILGIGTLWSDKKLVTGLTTIDPRFTGGASLLEYVALGGVDAFVPVENTGSEGTRDAHWRESVFGTELMTGYISGSSNPLSALTIASLTDLGYGTNPGAASGYTLGRSSGTVMTGIDLHKHERIMRPKYKVDRHGNKSKIDE